MEIDAEYRSRYFDNAATTPVDPRVLEEMLPYFSEGFGNANSIHEPGRRARAGVDLARERVAQLVGANYPELVVFTSGATETNNWFLQSFSSVACSPFEHSSVLETVIASGGEVLENDHYRLFPPLRAKDLTAVMLVNNETGAIFPAYPLGNALFRDLTQAVGKIPLDEHAFDAGSFSAHKFYGPKGVGACFP
ncbi:MAG: aminotransferase class V-fold PLP-dependent enzyme, partial [Chlorobia bacterium]|nr:aminotransferase class V-fold PLP-dependent enzyme [Fimbriimonadaceae bacterium]